MSDIRWSEPTRTDLATRTEKDDSCIRGLLHIHVWPDSVGMNVRTHGNTALLGKFPRDVPSGGRVNHGPFFEARTRWAIRRLDRQVTRLHQRQREIVALYGRLIS